MYKLDGYGWDWNTFVGSDECLVSNHRDLAKLDLVLDLVENRDCAVQAGGNLGIFPKYLAKYFNAVYTFEPDYHNFQLMCLNAREPNIVKIQGALGAFPSFVSTKQGSPTHDHEGVTSIANGPGIIPLMTIDSFKFPHCDLIYLDVEGWESFAIAGARQTIQRYRPIIVCEINICFDRVGVNQDDFLRTMSDLGYAMPLRLFTDNVFVHSDDMMRFFFLRDRLLYKMPAINGSEFLL